MSTMSKKKILLVEDNPDDVALAKRAFKECKEENGYDLAVTKNGKEAIDYLQKKPLPQFILLDLKLPIIDGFEVMKFIRSYQPTKLLPVIVLTSSNEESDINEVYRLGANSYIQKPINYKSFLNVVKMISSYWIKMNENPITKTVS